MSQSKLTVGEYSLLFLDLITTRTNFIGLNIISFFMLKSKHKFHIRCRPMAFGVRKQMSSAYIT